MKNVFSYTTLFCAFITLSAFKGCLMKQEPAISNKTGHAYNNRSRGGFEVADKNGLSRSAGPGLIPIEGGVFIMGGSSIESPSQELGMYNHKRQITVSSFYMDETEVSNTNWGEYLHWIKQNFKNDAEYYYNELPDTLVWRRPLSYNEPYVENYLRHPAYQDYPVVGVSWEQAERYCAWRTDRVNELILREQGYITAFEPETIKNLSKKNAAKAGPAATEAVKKPTEPFNTDIYLNGQYNDLGPNAKEDFSKGLVLPKVAKGQRVTTPKPQKRSIRLEDGVVKQPYRLPTEAEWEYAALALIGNTNYETVSENKIYPWNGLGISSPKKATRGLLLANFKRGPGDYMGVGGSLNDKGSLTVEVKSYAPNDFGLYNMAGNVNEWVSDVYRVSTFESTDALNPYRGNIFQDKAINPENGLLAKNRYNQPIKSDAITPKKQSYANKIANKMDTTIMGFKADQRGFKDGNNDGLYGEITLINSKSRVYKGGGWNDQVMWLNPAARRHMQQDDSAADLGFRCAMTMLGNSEVSSKGKPQFKIMPSKAFNAKK